MGLEEGDRKTADKISGKIRMAGHPKKALEERKARCLRGREDTHPLFLLPSEQSEPVVKLSLCDQEAFTEVFHRNKAQNAEAVADRLPVNKVNKRTVIVGMDRAGAPAPTEGTGLQFRPEIVHEGIKKGFR